MKYRYTKYIEGLLDGLDMESLVSRLSDLLLSSGFNNPWDPQDGADQSMQALHDAVLDALSRGLTQKMLHGAMAELHASAGEQRLLPGDDGPGV